MNTLASAILTASCLLCLGAAAADDALYHVSETTFGCASPDSTRALTDPQAPLTSDSPQFKTIFASGHCVTITPRSPWKFLSSDGADVAQMSYAGTVGQPGTYYIKVDRLVDPLGRHPGVTSETQTAPQVETTPAPDAAVPGANLSGPAALAPQPQMGAPAASPALTSGQTTPGEGTTSIWARAGWVLLAIAVIAMGVLIAWRPWRRRYPATYGLKLPAHVMADAARLAEENGATLDQFLATLIAERIGQMKAANGSGFAARKAGP